MELYSICFGFYIVAENKLIKIEINRLFKAMCYFCGRFMKKLYATRTKAFFLTIAQ